MQPSTAKMIGRGATTDAGNAAHNCLHK